MHFILRFLIVGCLVLLWSDILQIKDKVQLNVCFWNLIQIHKPCTKVRVVTRTIIYENFNTILRK